MLSFAINYYYTWKCILHDTTKFVFTDIIAVVGKYDLLSL